MSLRLYLHVPFCRKKCTYCAFVTRGVSAARVADYLTALAREIDLVAPLAAGRPLASVFVGGGTPSVLAPAELAGLFARLRAAFAIEGGAEITVEANPEGVTPERTAALAEHGVTRLSIGAQSAVRTELDAVHRTHTFADVARAVDVARAAGIADLNVDLMFGLPGQTAASFAHSLDAFLGLEPEHLSLYGLTVEPGTVLERRVRAGSALPTDDDQASMYEAACAALDAAGYDHYEIANAARPGRRARHNVGYWRRDDYLGLGPGAHGLLDETRTANTSDLAAYAARLAGGERPLVSREPLSLADRVAETLFLGLRLREGVDLAAAGARLGVPLAEVYRDVLARHAATGALDVRDGTVRLPRRFWFVAHDVLADFLAPDLSAAGRRSPDGRVRAA